MCVCVCVCVKPEVSGQAALELNSEISCYLHIEELLAVLVQLLLVKDNSPKDEFSAAITQVFSITWYFRNQYNSCFSAQFIFLIIIN